MVEATWVHYICRSCWDRRNPNTKPQVQIDADVACCLCGQPALPDGTWFRKEPKASELRCKGEHDYGPD